MSQVVERTALRTPGIGAFLRGSARLFLRLTGWRVDRAEPLGKKLVFVAAPHTSNWDWVYTLAVAFAADIDLHWMAKQSLFRWPFGGLMRWLGGIPVDRARGARALRQVIAAFRARDALIVAIPPEGTRARAAGWRRGFLMIARGAGVPFACGYLDYRRKVGGYGPVIHPTGDDEADFAPAREFYARIVGRHPECMSPLRLLDR